MIKRIKKKIAFAIANIRLWCWLLKDYLLVVNIILAVIMFVPPFILSTYHEYILVGPSAALSAAKSVDNMLDTILKRYETDFYRLKEYNQLSNATVSLVKFPAFCKPMLQNMVKNDGRLKMVSVFDHSGNVSAVASADQLSPPDIPAALIKQFWRSGAKKPVNRLLCIQTIPYIESVYPLNGRYCLYTRLVADKISETALRLVPGVFHMILLDSNGEIALVRSSDSLSEKATSLETRIVKQLEKTAVNVSAETASAILLDKTQKTKYTIYSAPVNTLRAKLVIWQQETRYTFIISILTAVSLLLMLFFNLLQAKSDGEKMRYEAFRFFK
nr:hypothetical protein [uncultured Desulfobacter sp.]